MFKRFFKERGNLKREDLNLKDFDILGIITLNDVQGIEEYVTPVIQDGKIQYYLSRSKEYYNVKSMTELALNREELKTKLTSEHSKRNFVILENMLNCSGKVYFKKFEQYILSGKDNRFESQMKLELSEGSDIKGEAEEEVLLEEYQNGPDKVTNPISKRIIKVLIDDVKDIVTSQDLDER